MSRGTQLIFEELVNLRTVKYFEPFNSCVCDLSMRHFITWFNIFKLCGHALLLYFKID
jgi:hypothetical protein